MDKDKLAEILDFISREAPKDNIVAFSLDNPSFFVYDENYSRVIEKLKEKNYQGKVSIFYNYDSKKNYSCTAA